MPLSIPRLGILVLSAGLLFGCAPTPAPPVLQPQIPLPLCPVTYEGRCPAPAQWCTTPETVSHDRT